MNKNDTPARESQSEGEKQSRSTGSGLGTSPPRQPRLRVGREIADTTWRMTVPVVIFAFIGIYADIKLNSKPLLTFVGVIIGFYFAVVLIKRQIKRSEDT